MPRTPEATTAPARTRLDKWLWVARMYKTRSLAAQAVEAGQVRVGDERVKPSHAVRVGEGVTVRKGGLVWALVVGAVSDRRGGAAEAAKLYNEGAESIAAREEEIGRRKAAAASAPLSSGRPTKRERRKLREFLEEG